MQIQVVFQEDGSATTLGRATARNASGAATGVHGEGKFIKQADVSSITLSVFDLSSATPDTAIATEILTVSAVILNTVVTSNEIWTKDSTGYNFLHDLAASYFPTGNHTYLLEYKFTLTGGVVAWGVYSGPAMPVRTS